MLVEFFLCVCVDCNETEKDGFVHGEVWLLILKLTMMTLEFHLVNHSIRLSLNNVGKKRAIFPCFSKMGLHCTRTSHEIGNLAGEIVAPSYSLIFLAAAGLIGSSAKCRFVWSLKM